MTDRHFIGDTYTTNATTVVEADSCTLIRIVVNTAGATSTVTVYDWDSSSNLPTAKFVASTVVQGFLDYEMAMSKGIVIVTAGGTPASITVIRG